MRVVGAQHLEAVNHLRGEHRSLDSLAAPLAAAAARARAAGVPLQQVAGAAQSAALEEILLLLVAAVLDAALQVVHTLALNHHVQAPLAVRRATQPRHPQRVADGQAARFGGDAALREAAHALLKALAATAGCAVSELLPVVHQQDDVILLGEGHAGGEGRQAQVCGGRGEARRAVLGRSHRAHRGRRRR